MHSDFHMLCFLVACNQTRPVIAGLLCIVQLRGKAPNKRPDLENGTYMYTAAECEAHYIKHVLTKQWVVRNSIRIQPGQISRPDR